MRTLVRGAASNYAVVVAQVVQLVLLTPLLLHKVGPAALSAWTVIFTALGYLRLVELGYGPSLARYVAASHGTRLIEVQRSGVRTAWSVGAVTLLVGEVAAAFSTTVDIADGFALAFAVSVLGRAVQSPAVAAGWIMFGAGQIVLRSALQTIRIGASTMSMAVALLLGADLVGFVVAGMIAEVLASGALVVACRRRVPDFDVRWRRTDPALRREMMRFSGGVFAFAVAAQVVVSSDVLVVGAFFGTSTLAVYAVAMRIIDGLTVSLSQGMDVLLPKFTTMRNDRDRLERAVRLGVSASIAFGFSFVAVFAALGESLVELWVGPDYHESYVIALMLSGGLLFNVPLRIVILASMATGDHQRIVRLALAEAATNIGLSLVLAVTVGVRGVALASLLTFALFNGLLMPRRLLPTLGIQAGFLLRRSLGAAMVAIPVGVLGNLLLDGVSPAATIPVAAGLMVLSVFLIAAVVVTGDARTDAIRALRDLRRPEPQQWGVDGEHPACYRHGPPR